ncbi:hypothetical protein ACFQY0_14915 [Haloferula chungangensis]|uniref:Xylose isomerase-like TIM barrel domain-containing protein n=1 Tax=Haloferula chungangensis TaxID=1048331 RepID=A0ABW2L9P6_9BACT
MEKDITLIAPVELGFVPTHAKFVGGLVPDADGRLPRSESGGFVVVEAVREVLERSRVKVDMVQVPIFPGTHPEEYPAQILALRELGLKVHLVIMLGGVDPMDPADEDATIAQLLPTLKIAKELGITHLASTSIEGWMVPGATPKRGADFDAVVAQTVKVHARAYHEAGLEDSSVSVWDIEFLRPGEFQTFTDLGKLWSWVQKANEEIGKPFFRCLVDAAHCGDSALDIPTNEKLISEIAAAGGLGMMHASAKTTRGCLSTDDGWVAALLGAGGRSGALSQVSVEMFHHEDEALVALRQLDPGHGVDTLDGRDYTQVVADGLASVARILNNYVNRGWMPKA